MGPNKALRRLQSARRLSASVNCMDQQMQPNTPIIAIIALMFVGGGYCFPQSHKTGQTMNTNIRQEERIAALEKRIAEAGDDFVSLTAEEYDLLLSRPIGPVDGFNPLTTTAGGIMVGIGFNNKLPNIHKTDIQILFPEIPNIRDVFVVFDFVKGTNSLDFLDRNNSMETEEDESTILALERRIAGSKPCWFGRRRVRLRRPKNDVTTLSLESLGGDVKVAAVSGKVVMHLPTNITGLDLAKGDIGVEKPFAGGVITLKEIKDDNISFQFAGDSKKIYAWTVYSDSKKTYTWTVYDGTNPILDMKEVFSNEGLYQLPAEHPTSVKIYQAEIVRKEYPFTFRNESPATSETVYLDSNDPIGISIKGRAVTDLKQSIKIADPRSPENELLRARAWSQGKPNHVDALFKRSMNDYTAQIPFDVRTFMLVFYNFIEMDQKTIAEKIAEGYDIRVHYLGGDTYVAEFWQDVLVATVNAETQALASTNNPVDRESIKTTFAIDRKSIEEGKQERYFKAMALLYTLEKDGSITFHDPFQPVIDFMKSNTASGRGVNR